MNKILIIDDDIELCTLIKRSVLSEQIDADFCNTGKDRWSRIKTYRYLIYYMSILGRCICNVHPAIKVSSLASSTIPRHVSPTMSFILFRLRPRNHLKQLIKLVLPLFVLLVVSKNIVASVCSDYYINQNSCIFKLSTPVMLLVNSIHLDICVPAYLVKGTCPHL